MQFGLVAFLLPPLSLSPFRLVPRGSLEITLSPSLFEREQKERERKCVRGKLKEREENRRNHFAAAPMASSRRRSSEGLVHFVLLRGSMVRHSTLCLRAVQLRDHNRRVRQREEEEQKPGLGAYLFSFSCAKWMQKKRGKRRVRKGERERAAANAGNRQKRFFFPFQRRDAFALLASAPAVPPILLLPRRSSGLFSFIGAAPARCSRSKPRPREVDALGQALARRRRRWN